MLLNILLVILVFVCVALTGVILLQRSEGGALGVGGGPSGMFTARGAGDLLTKTTAILAAAFFVLSLAITLLAGHNRASSSVTERLKVAPEDLSTLAKPSASGAPASSQVAPPLPTTAPPMPTQAPRPTLQAPAKPRTQGSAQISLPDVTVRPSTRIPLPKPDLNAAAPPAEQPAPAGKP